MNNEQFSETEADLYHEGCQARIQNAPFDAVKPRPWKLGWQDTDIQMLPVGYFGHRKDGSAKVFRRITAGSPTGQPLDPQLHLRRHSPSGLEWGYMGSGPAQLSLAILVDHLGDIEQAQDFYQDFKAAVVVDLNHDEWVLSEEDVRDALETIRAEHALRSENSLTYAERMPTQVDIADRLVEFAPVDMKPMRAAYVDVESASLPEPTVRVKLAESRKR